MSQPMNFENKPEGPPPQPQYPSSYAPNFPHASQSPPPASNYPNPYALQSPAPPPSSYPNPYASQSPAPPPPASNYPNPYGGVQLQQPTPSNYPNPYQPAVEQFPPGGLYAAGAGGYAPSYSYAGGGGYAPVPQGPQSPYGQQPIAVQPQPQDMPPGDWMAMPQAPPPDCPPGLEYLSMIDQLLVHQKVELLEALVGFETNNKYAIKNSIGQKVYYAVEDSGCCARCCCGPCRPFDMKILDNFQREVVHMYRPLACSCCLFPCCLQSIEVSSPPGTVVGTVEQEWTLCYPCFSIKNSAGDTVLRIEGPLCQCACLGDINFKILTTNGEKIGKICKQWSGLVREIFTDADHFGITFPLDLDVKMKAVLLGALFLIDMMFFEKTQDSAADNAGFLTSFAD